MKGFTHLAAGTLTGIALSQAICPNQSSDAMIVVVATAVGSILPDIDIGTSKLGRLIPALSYTIQFLFGHRGICHSLIFWVIPLLYLYFSYPAYQLFVIAGGCGILTHLLLDMLNPSGVPLFWPSSRRFHVAGFHSGGIIDWLLGGSLAIGCLYLLFTLKGIG